MQIEYIAISELKRHPRNPKDHDLGVLNTSINRFGYVLPMLIDERTGLLVAGHGRLDALLEMRERGKTPPERIESRDDDWYVPVIRGVTFNSDSEIEAYLIADNQLVVAGGWNEPALAELLQELAEQDVTLLEATGFDMDDLDALIYDLENQEFTEGDGERSDGSLLGLTGVTINDPAHIVIPGEVWLLGEHKLICADVLTEWSLWASHLSGDVLFVPFPGPFAPLTKKAEGIALVMVQPDPYIAGHILDRYVEIHGEDGVRKDD